MVGTKIKGCADQIIVYVLHGSIRPFFLLASGKFDTGVVGVRSKVVRKTTLVLRVKAGQGILAAEQKVGHLGAGAEEHFARLGFPQQIHSLQCLGQALVTEEWRVGNDVVDLSHKFVEQAEGVWVVKVVVHKLLAVDVEASVEFKDVDLGVLGRFHRLDIEVINVDSLMSKMVPGRSDN